MKITIKDYQAIKDTTLNIGPGITAVIGPTNSGKSSIIRAVQGAINNQSGTGFINYDAEESKVIIEEGDNIIEWVKSKKGPAKYIINGEEVNKIGRQQNEEVAALINMEEVDIGGVNFRLNFWNQMEKAFLMDRSPNQLFNFMSQSNEQEQVQELDEIKKAEHKDITDVTKRTLIEIDVLTADITTQHEELKLLEKFTTFDLERLKQVIEVITNLEDLNAKLQEYKNRHFTTMEALQNINLQLGGMNIQLNAAETIIKELDEVTDKKNTLNDLRNRLDKAKDLKQAIEDKLKETKISDKIYLDQIETKLNEVDDLVKQYNDLSTLNKKRVDQETIIKTNQEVITNKTKELEELKQELSKIDTCPFCGSNITEGNHTHKEETK